MTGSPSANHDTGESVALTLGRALGPAPRLGLGLDPDEIGTTRERAAVLETLGAGVLVCHYDPRRDHGRDTLRALAETAAMVGAEPWLEAVVAQVEGFAEEVAALGRDVDALGSPFPTVLLSPAPDMKCTLPGSDWPPAPPADALFRVAREAFPHARIGGGMFSYFTAHTRSRASACFDPHRREPSHARHDHRSRRHGRPQARGSARRRRPARGPGRRAVDARRRRRAVGARELRRRGRDRYG